MSIQNVSSELSQVTIFKMLLLHSSNGCSLTQNCIPAVTAQRNPSSEIKLSTSHTRNELPIFRFHFWFPSFEWWKFLRVSYNVHMLFCWSSNQALWYKATWGYVSYQLYEDLKAFKLYEDLSNAGRSICMFFHLFCPLQIQYRKHSNSFQRPYKLPEEG